MSLRQFKRAYVELLHLFRRTSDLTVSRKPVLKATTQDVERVRVGPSQQHFMDLHSVCLLNVV